MGDTKIELEFPQPTKQELEDSEDPSIYLDGWIAACKVLMPQIEALQEGLPTCA